MQNSSNLSPSQELGFWKNHQAIVELLTYSIVLASACVAICLFLTRDNRESQYKAQVASHEAVQVEMQTIINQLQSRINFLETENERLYFDNSNYINLLREIPGTYDYLIALNEKLTLDNENLLEVVRFEADSVSPLSIDKSLYTKTYSNMRVNSVVYDDETSVVINFEYVARDNDFAKLKYTLPSEDTYYKFLHIGDVLNFKVNETPYQLIVETIDYTSNTCGFTIRQIGDVADINE